MRWAVIAVAVCGLLAGCGEGRIQSQADVTGLCAIAGRAGTAGVLDAQEIVAAQGMCGRLGVYLATSAPQQILAELWGLLRSVIQQQAAALISQAIGALLNPAPVPVAVPEVMP